MTETQENDKFDCFLEDANFISFFMRNRLPEFLMFAFHFFWDAFLVSIRAIYELKK